MKFFRSSLAFVLTAALASAAPGFDPVAFSPKDWPGKAPTEVTRALGPLGADYARAMQSRDAANLALAREKIVAVLGPYAGVPEERPAYGQPVDPTVPDHAKIATLWESALKAQTGRFGWDQARQLETAPGAGGKVPRLRVSERQIRALLQTHEAGLDPTGAYLKAAIAGLDYLLTAQAANGCFGYPFDPKGAGLRSQAAAAVDRGEKQGVKMVERGWVIEDLGNGGLNFDNGVCGAVLVQGYALTGDKRYLDSAIRAGTWAKNRPLVLNFNYNGFNGMLLARLYRATGDCTWLDAAKPIFDFGVLSAQMPNGRWIDQHNAKIQYHAILCAQVTEYLLALRLAQDDAAPRVEKQLRLSLDNLAAELTTHGTNNAEEALSLSALAIGLMVVGPEPAWNKGLNVAVNFITGPGVALFRSRGGVVPEPIAAWLLQQAISTSKLTSSEARPAILIPPARK